MKWPPIGAELAIFKGVICERAEILGAISAPLNSNVAQVFSKLAFHMVQFGPYDWVDLAQKLVPKTTPFQWGRIDPKPVSSWTYSFWPHFWGQINNFHFSTLYSFPLNVISQNSHKVSLTIKLKKTVL